MSESGTHHTLGELFEQALGMEQKAAEMYGELTKLFSHVPEISQFWAELSRDEIQHKRLLEEAYKSLADEQLSSRLERSIWRSLVSVQDYLDKDLIGPIKNLDDAYEIAHQLEFYEINTIFKFLANEVVPTNDRRGLLLSTLQEHQDKLMNFNENFGDRAWRRGITCR